VVLGVLSGTVLLIWGDVLRPKPKYRLLSLGMAGVGISALYLSIYAAFSFYALVQQPVAFVFMIIVTAAGVFLSVRYNSLTISLIALMGGFLTPVLLSTGENRPIPLFTYLLILNAGVLALAFKKDWKALNILCMALSYLWFGAWYSEFYTEDQFSVGFTFLSLFFLVFALLAFVHNVLFAKKTRWWDAVVLLGNPVIYFPVSLGLLQANESIHGLFAIALAGVYFSLGALAYKRNPADTYLLFLLLSVAVTCLVVAVPLQFEGRWVTIAWTTEGVALWWLGLKYRSEKTEIAALLLFLIAAFDLLAFGSHYTLYDVTTQRYAFTPIFNSRFAVYLYFTLSLGTCVFLARRMAEQGTKITQGAAAVFSVAAAFVLLLAFSMESTTYFNSLEMNATKIMGSDFSPDPATDAFIQDYRNASRLSISGIWVVYSMILIGLGIYRRHKLLRVMAIIVFGITIFKVFLYDLSFLKGMYRISSFIGLGIVLMLVSFLYQKYKGFLDDRAT